MIAPAFLERELSAAGFLQRARDARVEGDETGWVVRGTTDRSWVYAGGRAEPLLRSHDTHFAALTPSLAEAIARTRTLVWTREALSFELPAEIALPKGVHSTAPLTLADAETVDAHWEHRDEVSFEYVKACLSRDPSMGVRVEGTLVGWELVHDDGALGAAFVLPEFRRRGVMRSLQFAMVEALRARGLPVFKHVSIDNHRWLPAQEPAGWRVIGTRVWLEVAR